MCTYVTCCSHLSKGECQQVSSRWHQSLHPYIHRGGVTIDTGLWCDVLFLVTWLSGIPLVCKFAYLSDRRVACTRDCRAECPDAVPYQRRHGSGMEANPTEDLHPLVQ